MEQCVCFTLVHLSFNRERSVSFVGPQRQLALLEPGGMAGTGSGDHDRWSWAMTQPRSQQLTKASNLRGALAGKNIFLYSVGPNPAAGAIVDTSRCWVI